MDARSSYRETTARGASPVQLVILLYEQAIEDLRRAVLALEKGNIEVRTCSLNHAIIVIGQLQASLDMERGANVARNLQQFYTTMRASLIDAQLKQSARIVEEQIAQLVLLREAWLEVELATAKPSPPPAESAPSETETPHSPPSSSGWNA
jgi:flagellar protein FliS